MKRKMHIAAEYAVLIAISFIAALEYMIFIDKNQFAPSGLMGVATMIQYVTGFSVGYMTLIMNVPLCIAAYFIVGHRFAFRTAVYIILQSVMLLIFQKDIIDISKFVYYTEDGISMVLAPIASGVICGLYYGAVIKLNGSTGGTDIFAAMIQKAKPHLNMMWIIFALNVTVAIASYFVYGYNMQPVILCILYSFIVSNVSDKMLRGGKSALKFEVITDQPEELAEDIMCLLGRGVTILSAKGMYTKHEHALLVCVINKHQIARFNAILKLHGESFAYISSVSEVLGNFYDRK